MNLEWVQFMYAGIIQEDLHSHALQVSVTGWHYSEYAGLSMLYITNRQNSYCILLLTNGSRMAGWCSCVVPCFLHVCWKTNKIWNWLLIKCSPQEAAEINWAFEKVLNMIKLTGHLAWFILRPMRLNTESLHSHAPTLAARGELHFNELLILVCVPVIITDLMNIYVSCLKFRDVRKRKGMLWRS